MVCLLQRRAESPIRIQPRAAPWVKRFQQTCALKEQKEGARTSILLAPVALTARQLVNEFTPRVLPWAVFPLGLRPVFARNHGCCTLRRIILLLGLRPVFARKHGSCTFRWIIFLLPLCVAIAYNIGSCTFRWIIFLLGLRPAIACNHGSYTFRRIIFLFGLRPAPARYISCNAMHDILFVYGSTFSHNRISCVFTTRPCRSVSFRCYDEKYFSVAS